MNRNVLVWHLLVVSLSAFVTGGGAMAQQAAAPSQVLQSTPAIKAYRKSIEEHIYSQAWAPQGANDRPIIPYRGARARMTIAEDGTLSEVKLLQSSGKDFADFYCLEALLTSSPLPRPPYHSPRPAGRRQLNGPLDEVIDFYETSMPDYFQIKPSKFTNEAFFTQHPELKNSAVVLHLLPLSILKYYPDLFTAAELNGSENIKVIPTQGLLNYGPDFTTDRTISNQAIIKFFKNWESFVKGHPVTTRKELLAFRSEQSKLFD